MKSIQTFGLAIIAALALSTTSCRHTAPVDTALDYPALSLSTFAYPLGDWEEVKDVSLDPAAPMALVGEPGTGVIYNGASGRTTNILTKERHGDARVHLEFNVPKGSNSGVYFQGRYEVQILDSWGVSNPGSGDCGGIYERWIDGKGVGGTPPQINASLRPGQWQSLDVIFRAPRFNSLSEKIQNAQFVEVRLNGVVIHSKVEADGPTRSATYEADEKPIGPIMIQGDHGPVAYRNLLIEELNLN
jgi:hypothetical protein